MKCIVCHNGETHPGTTTVTFHRDGQTIVVTEVPAEVCENCGEVNLPAFRGGSITSVGSRGDSYGCAMTESIIGHYKAELVHLRATIMR